MKAHNVFKVPSGKLIKVDLDFDPDNKLITTVKITGDFFMHPEETLEGLEEMLRNTKLDRTTLYHLIDGYLRKHTVEVYGFTPDFLVDTILGCIGRR